MENESRYCTSEAKTRENVMMMVIGSVKKNFEHLEKLMH